MELRVDLQKVVASLLAESAHEGTIALDRIGNALGTLAVSTDDIDAVFRQLETAGRQLAAPPGGGGEARLRRVIEAARTLKQHSDARPTLSAVAERSQLSHDEVLGALFLLRIMQR